MMQFSLFSFRPSIFPTTPVLKIISHQKIVKNKDDLDTLILNPSKTEFFFCHLDNIYDKLKIVRMLYKCCNNLDN